MFFVPGLTSKGKEVLVNPDQVLYVSPSGAGGKKSILIMTHSQRLLVDQTSRQLNDDSKTISMPSGIGTFAMV
jgi:hypothetical protein